MPKTRISLAAAVLLVVAGAGRATAHAAGPTPPPVDLDALAQGDQSALEGVAPWAGVVTSSTGRPGWSVLNFYVYRTGGVVRLRARLTEGRFLEPAKEQYLADGATCPALRDVMLAAEGLRPAPLHDDLLSGGARDIILDGVRYRLWGEAEGPMAHTEFSEAEGGRLSAYVGRARAALASCWTRSEAVR